MFCCTKNIKCSNYTFIKMELKPVQYKTDLIYIYIYIYNLSILSQVSICSDKQIGSTMFKFEKSAVFVYVGLLELA